MPIELAEGRSLILGHDLREALMSAQRIAASRCVASSRMGESSVRPHSWFITAPAKIVLFLCVMSTAS